MAVIEISGLHKSFGATRALNGLDLEVPRGQVLGFLGPNGAGKSTTIRILLGLLRADGGRVRVLGMDPWANAPTLNTHLAYVPGDVALWPNLTGGEMIDILTGLHASTSPSRRHDLIEHFELDPSKKCRTYSTGNRQKVALIAALASDAELLILDEPTSGLDPLMETVFDACVRDARDRGCTIVLSSHLLSQVEKLADALTIIRDGQVVESGSLAELRHVTRSHITAVLRHPHRLSLPESGVHDVSLTDDTLTCAVDANALDGVLTSIAHAGSSSLVCHPPSLEELFLRHYSVEGHAR